MGANVLNIQIGKIKTFLILSQPEEYSWYLLRILVNLSLNEQSVKEQFSSGYNLICNGEKTAQAKMVHYDVIKYYINSNIQNPKAPTTMLKIRPFVSFRKVFRHAA